MDGVATPIIGRPRPLPGHDTPNPAYHPHTLNYEEPVMMRGMRMTSPWPGGRGLWVCLRLIPVVSWRVIPRGVKESSPRVLVGL